MGFFVSAAFKIWGVLFFAAAVLELFRIELAYFFWGDGFQGLCGPSRDLFQTFCAAPGEFFKDFFF